MKTPIKTTVRTTIGTKIDTLKNIIHSADTGNNNQRMPLLITGASLIILIFLIFSIIIPAINNIKLNDAAVKNQRAILTYILKYSNKINELKSADKAKKKLKVNSAIVGSSVKTVKTGYIKFINSLIKYFKLNKNNVSKLYSKYSNKKQAENGISGNKKGNESIFISLKGLSLNQCVNMVNALSSSSSAYNAKIVAIKLKKNFKNDKLLNLSLNIDRQNTNNENSPA